jgi:hypothetical protein
LFLAATFWNTGFAGKNFTGSFNVAMAGITVSPANICANSMKIPIVSFTLTSTKTGADVSKPVLSAFNFTTATQAAVGDIIRFQLWTNTSNNLAAATQLGADIMPTLGTLTYSFTALDKILPMRLGAFYFWVTMDVTGSPVNNHTVSVKAPATSDLTFSVSPNTVSGAGKAGGMQTLKANATIGLTSAVGTDAQTVRLNTAIINIVYTIGGAGTGASITAGALPPGVNGSFNAGVFTISGTPTVAGIFSYTVGTSGSSCINETAGGTITTATVVKLAYLEDADTTHPPAPTTLPISIANYPFPRLSNHVWSPQAFTAERMSKYRVVTCDGTHIDEAVRLKATYPDAVSLRYFCPVAYQGEMWSMPFLGTGPSTDGQNVYAGHWLYLAGSTTTTSLTTTGTSVGVTDVTRFAAGQYIVIYDAPAGSFQSAEHAYISAVNQSTKTLTLSQRGCYSQPLAHAATSIIAPHELADDPDLLNKWSYNQSSLCPRDANGKTLGEVMADWLRDNLNRNSNGIIVNAYEGLMFDTDGWKAAARDDVNNDLIPDGGMIGEENTWNTGIEAFYARLRGYYPTALLSGGSPNSQGFATLNGTQMEGLPTRKHLDYPPDYTILDELMQKYSMHMHHQGIGPVYCEDKSKTPTLLFDPQIAKDNSTFRLSFGMTLMEDGYYGNGGYDHWFDEYAVNINQGSPEYGNAIASTPLDESQVRANLGWLGKPLGPHYRIYDSSKFIANKTLLSNGSFEASLSGWSVSQRRGVNTLDINLDNTTSAEGAFSLHASKMKTYSSVTGGAKIYAPLVNLKANVQYTICFSMKSSEFRQINLQLSNMEQQFYISTKWMRYVACFTSATAGAFSPAFLVGQQNTEVWIDAIYVFEGNADVFRRDFDNGIIVANASPDTVSVDLSGTFQRIKGTGQDPINDGSTITKVKLPPYDAAILLRPDTNRASKSFSILNSITDSTKQASFSLLYPNPVASFLNATFSAFDTNAEIQIVNVLGQVMQQKSLIIQRGINIQQMNVSGLSPGIYILLIKTKSQLFKGKFVKI